MHTKIDVAVTWSDGGAWWRWHKARGWIGSMPIDYGGDGSPGWVVVTKNGCVRVQKVEISIKFDKNDIVACK